MNGIEIKANGNRSAEILIYDEIGKNESGEGITAKQFSKDLKALGELDTLNIRFNTPGGSYVQAIAICSTLAEHKAHKIGHVDGAAFSAGSLVLQACDERRMARSALMLVHGPYSRAEGSAADMRSAADLMDKTRAKMVEMYAARSGQSPEAISAMLDQDTWLDAEDALAAGFIDQITGEMKIAAHCSPELFNKVPDTFKDRVVVVQEQAKTPKKKAKNMAETASTGTAAAHSEPQMATIDSLTASCRGADDAFICAQLRAKATQKDAENAWRDELSKRLDAATKTVAELKSQKTEPTASSGVDPLATGKKAAAADDLDPKAAWTEAIDAEVKRGKLRSDAVCMVARKHPELRAAYLESFNAERRSA